MFRGQQPPYPEIPSIPERHPAGAAAGRRRSCNDIQQKVPIERVVEDLLSAVNGFNELVNSPDLKADAGGHQPAGQRPRHPGAAGEPHGGDRRPAGGDPGGPRADRQDRPAARPGPATRGAGDGADGEHAARRRGGAEHSRAASSRAIPRPPRSSPRRCASWSAPRARSASWSIHLERQPESVFRGKSTPEDDELMRNHDVRSARCRRRWRSRPAARRRRRRGSTG